MGKPRQTIAPGWRWSQYDSCRNIIKAGYCQAYVTPIFEAEASRAAHEADFHDSDHATEAEARTCYRAFQLDQQLDLGSPLEYTQPCVIDQIDTDKAAKIGELVIPLCDTHRTRASVETIYAGPYDDDL